MRHFFLSLAAASAALLCGIGTAHAVPAKPGLIQVTQSDGTQLTVRLVGDERRHYMLSSDGYTLTGGPDGDLYYAELSASGKLIPTKVKARPVNALTADEKAVVSRLGKELKPTYVKPMVMPAPQQTQAPVLPAAGKPAPPRRITSAQTTGRLKSLIILVESSDKKFASASAQQDFRNLLMQDGYSVNGATGSAWNYYQDNSNRLFDPEFVVVGPYKASKTSAYYAGSDGSENVAELIVEACRLADNDVNFTDFADNGVIRDVFVFYAGRGQADSGDTQTIWPHRWDVRVNSKYLDVRFDGVQLQGYACGAELNGGYQMTAIGTFCHEFGHVLGWPDFYDTDDSASGGTTQALESFSLMCSGSYNNNSRTPPSVNILERWMVGWAEPEEVTENGLYTLAPVSENKGYLVQTPTTNDYFLLENRDTRNNKWDQPLNSAAACRGLLVYHVDYTSRYAPQWSYNTLNNNPAHECMKLVRSGSGPVVLRRSPEDVLPRREQHHVALARNQRGLYFMEQRQTFRFVQRYKTRRFAGPAVGQDQGQSQGRGQRQTVRRPADMGGRSGRRVGDHMEIGRHTAFGDRNGMQRLPHNGSVARHRIRTLHRTGIRHGGQQQRHGLQYGADLHL